MDGDCSSCQRRTQSHGPWISVLSLWYGANMQGKQRKNTSVWTWDMVTGPVGRLWEGECWGCLGRKPFHVTRVLIHSNIASISSEHTFRKILAGM